MTTLVGDIGGTNVRLALASGGQGKRLKLSEIWHAPTADFPQFSDAVDAFLSHSHDTVKRGPDAAVFALAGPVSGDTIKITNNHWTIQRKSLLSQFGFKRLYLMNDFAAMARSVPELPDEAFLKLQAGEPKTGHPMIIAGAGTGLGQSMLSFNSASSSWSIFPGEGGHQSYAPQTRLESEVTLAMKKRFGHVTFEMICSGQHMPQVYGALCDVDGAPYLGDLTAKMITNQAKAGEARAVQCCTIAAHALMGFIGDAVVASGAWSGAVLAGGVSQHLKEYLATPSALAYFNTKGAMTQRIRKLPLSLLIDNRAPLIGAACSDHRE